jgi:hypothetical protein
MVKERQIEVGDDFELFKGQRGRREEVNWPNGREGESWGEKGEESE